MSTPTQNPVHTVVHSGAGTGLVAPVVVSAPTGPVLSWGILPGSIAALQMAGAARPPGLPHCPASSWGKSADSSSDSE